MEELRKIYRILEREYPDAYLETLVVLDGTTGQNALAQARQFAEVANVTFTDGTVFTLWISDDENKIPLYIESPVRVGSINAYISGYKGLKYPMTSLIK